VNPDTGKFHEVTEIRVDECTTLRSMGMARSKDGVIRRLKEDAPEANLVKGDEVPSHWPTFVVDELLPIRGHFFAIEKIESGRLVLKYHSVTKAEKRRQEKK